MDTQLTYNKSKLALLVCFFAYWIYTFISTHDKQNWFIENGLVFIFIAFYASQKNMGKLFSTLSFTCLFLFIMMHISGSQYAYTHHPLGEWLRNALGTSRNMYDRIVHFSFGFLIALPLKEFIQQKTNYTGTLASTLSFLWISTLAMVFELIEWIVGGVIFKEASDDYVGTQGDVWDPQKDMALAFVGAALVLFVIGRFLNRKAYTNSATIHLL
jgi:putative membrane protein